MDSCDNDEWMARIGAKQIIGLTKIQSKVEKWNLMVPLELKPPAANHYYSVLETTNFGQKVHSKIKSQYKFNMFILAFFSIVSLIVLFWSPSNFEKAFKLFVGFLTMFSFLVVDYKMVIQNRMRSAERNWLLIWVYKKTRLFTPILFIVLLTFILLQLYVQSQYDDFDAFGLQFAIVFSEISLNNILPLIYGPFIHHDLAHWLINATMLMLIGPIIWAVSKRAFLSAMLLGNLTGVFIGYGEWLMRLSESVGYVGVSAGTYALWGVGIAYSFKNKDRVPIFMGWTFMSFSVAFSIFSLLFSPVSTFLFHTGGLLTGILIGYLCAQNEVTILPEHLVGNKRN